jgi:L-rhamnose mutarotase
LAKKSAEKMSIIDEECPRIRRRGWAMIYLKLMIFMMPMQDPLPNLAAGAWWADMEEVFHTD